MKHRVVMGEAADQNGCQAWQIPQKELKIGEKKFCFRRTKLSHEIVYKL